MKVFFLSFILATGLYFSIPSPSKANVCDGVTTIEIVECAEDNTQKWDKRLNKAYQSLMRILSPLDAKALKDLQRKWMAYRDAMCGFQLETGTMRLIIRAGCFENMTKSQALHLEFLLKEQ